MYGVVDQRLQQQRAEVRGGAQRDERDQQPGAHPDVQLGEPADPARDAGDRRPDAEGAHAEHDGDLVGSAHV